MGRLIADRSFKTIRSSRHSTRQIARRRSRVLCEAMENRQLMSLTIEVRGLDGTTTNSTVTSVGQVVNLEVLAVITDHANQPTQDGVNDVDGSFLSTAVFGHAVAGNLAATNVTPFKSSGAAPGTIQDLNGDGNLDVGTNNTNNTQGLFFARSSPGQTGTSGTGTISGNSLIFVIGHLNYTVTNLNKGGQTSINFSPAISPRPDAAAWVEDGLQIDNLNGTYQAGSAYTVSDPPLVVAPTAVNDTATVTRNTPTIINELANDDIVVPLNDASVHVTSAPTHGTFALQSNGSIQYTPTTGYTGPDSFMYTVADTDGRVSNPATVTINVVLAPPPTAVDDTAATLLNQPVTISVLANDTDPAGVAITPSSVTIVTPTTHGTAAAQSDGTVIYTPAAGYTGTDSFTYTITDANQETSTAATVTITTSNPVPPTANNDSFATTAGAPLTCDVLTNDTVGSKPIDPTTVVIASPPVHGTALAQPGGTVLYTPDAGFTGNDSFTYTVADTIDDVSAAAVVSLSITHSLPPTATNVTAPVLSGQPNIINVLSNVSSGAPVVPGSVKVVTAPSNGTATPNTDGTISYTPVAGFVGTDSFTYTVGNSNLDTTNQATVSVDVGTSISNAKGSAHSLVFTDAAGGLETISLNKGMVEIFFTGTGSVTTTKAGKATVTGAGLELGNLILTSTTKASTLTVKGSAKTGATLGGITDAVGMGSIIAPSINIAGNVTLNNASTLVFGSVANATITVGAGPAAKLSLTTGAVTDSSLSSAIPLTLLKAASWENTSTSFGPSFMGVVNGNPLISAPSIASLIVAGGLRSDLSLTATGKAPALGSAKVSGLVGPATWVIAGGAKSLVFGSVAPTWAGSITGALGSLAIKGGGFGATLGAGGIGQLSVVGDLSSQLTNTGPVISQITSTGPVGTVRITGGMNASSLAFASTLGQLTVGGAVTSANILTNGSIRSIRVGSISGSNVSAGVATTFTINGPDYTLTNTPVTLSTASAADLGSSKIGSFTVTSKTAGAFSGTAILAGNIGTAALGTIATANNSVAFGIAAKKTSTLTATFSSGTIRLSPSVLQNQEVLTAYLNQQGAVLGDFQIMIAT